MTSDGSVPQFSIVSAVHDVARYLPDFLASLDAQTLDPERFEVVLVDDGSTDEGPQVLREWRDRTRLRVTLLEQANAGQGAARNLGLEHVTGEWISFADPDDVLGPDYLAEVADALRVHPEAEMVACRLWMRRDAEGVVEDTHPLRHRFADGVRLRDLDEDPAYFFVSVPAGFLRRDHVERLGLRFDHRIRPNFEDAHLAGRYLLALDRPLVLFVPGARYEYRKRADSSSTLQTSMPHPGRYTDVLEHGYLDLVRRSLADGGEVPGWLNHLLLYDLGWMLRPTVRAMTDTEPALEPVAERFHALMAELTPHLDPEAPLRAEHPRYQRMWRDALAHGWADEPWVSPVVRVVRHDPRQQAVCLSYHHRGARPVESFERDGTAVAAVASTVRPFSMMRRVLLHERRVWVPLDDDGLVVRLDGEVRRVDAGPGGPVDVLRPDDVGPARRVGVRPAYPSGDRRRVVAAVADAPGVRQRFADAWVLMDRVHEADDNAERLFEHLRAERRDLNAWFVVERGTPSWDRLRRRFGRRVVAYGSRTWKLLMLGCTHLVSSHVDPGVVRPSALVRPGEPLPWRVHFIEHGVIKDDLSSWLNLKPLDLFVTSTAAEHASVLGDDTGYVFTEREVALTGLPRFDRLLRLGSAVPAGGQRRLLVCPTWRHWLIEPMTGDSMRRDPRGDFHGSEFAESWLALLRSDELRAVADRHGVTVGFLPHPILQRAFTDVALPDHVERLRFDDADVQQLIAESRVMVTDYSSMAFNAAYLDRPVVYWQFDRDRMFGGDHVGTGGYFDYPRDGFGPVADTLAQTLTALDRLLDAGSPDRAEYAARVAATFPERDGRCCERVVAAIEASVRPVPVVSTATSSNH